MSKYKTGDIVKISQRIHGHQFKINSLVEIRRVDSDESYTAVDGLGDVWGIYDDEIEDSIKEWD